MHSDFLEEFRLREGPAKTSQVLRDFVQMLGANRVSLEEFIAALGDRGLGVLIAVFAFPNILPSTVLFGNVVTGLPVIFLAVHLMLGWQRLVLPRVLARRTIGTQFIKVFVPKLAAALSRIETLLKPRLLAVTGPLAERLIGAFCFVLSIVSTLPIPFGHNLPALGLMMIGLGLTEHDGLAVLSGVAVGLVGMILLILILSGIETGLTHFHF